MAANTCCLVFLLGASYKGKKRAGVRGRVNMGRWGGGAKVIAVVPNPACGQWSYLECGHGWIPAIPVYGVELGRVVELMVQLRMSFASVHHFLEGKRGRDSKKNEPNRKKKRKSK